MKDITSMQKDNFFGRLSSKVTTWTGSSAGFSTALMLVVIWGASGPLFHYSEAWQMIINTGTTIITFLMVFLIQKTQNKDAIAIQIKLNELVAANASASNRIVSVEDLSEDELIRLNEYYTRLAEITKKEKDPKTSRSIEDTTILQDEKKRINKRIGSLTK